MRLGMAQEKLSTSEEKSFKTKVQETAKNTKTIVSDFTQLKHISMLDDDITSQGKLVFKAPNMVKWEYLTPFYNSAIFIENQLLVNNEGKKDQLDLSANKLFRSLNSLIVNSIKGDMFDESQFDISYFRSSGNYLVKFIPKDKRLRRFMSAFELRFSKDKAEVEEVKLIESNADYTVITFQNRTINGEVDEAVFNQ